MDGGRRRARDLGLHFGGDEPGPLNAITDVPGVRVGHTTVIAGADVRTGVTAVVPDALERAGGALTPGCSSATASGSWSAPPRSPSSG